MSEKTNYHSPNDADPNNPWRRGFGEGFKDAMFVVEERNREIAALTAERDAAVARVGELEEERDSLLCNLDNDSITTSLLRKEYDKLAARLQEAERAFEMLRDYEVVARWFHAYYEKLALSYGYETRKESAVAWEDVPENNRRLMVATVEQVVSHYLDNAALASLREGLGEEWTDGDMAERAAEWARSEEGQRALSEAASRAEEMSKQFRDAIRIDLDKLNRPVDI